MAQNTPGSYYSPQSNSLPKTPSFFRTGCDCYSAPACFNNCSSVSGLLSQLLASSEFLQALPTPFSITMPQQLRKRRLKYDTSTANKYSHFSQAQFLLNLPGVTEPIQIKVKKSNVVSEYSTLYYRTRNGVVSEVESTKIEECFYTGEVETAPNASFVAVATCSGLRGAIYYNNTTFLIIPLPCPSCDSQTAPPIVLPSWLPSPIAQNTSMRTFWKPVDFMAMMQTTADQQPVDPVNALHTIWLELIVDANLLSEFHGNFTTTLRYMASVVNLVNLHFKELPVQIHLLRTHIWNVGNRVLIEDSIKATLNNMQLYRSQQTTHDKVELHRSARNSEEEADFPAPSSSSSPQGVFKQPSFRKADIMMLLTDSFKTKFVEGVDYLAIPGSICTPRGTAVIRVRASDFEFRLAALVSKSIAQILGIHSIPCPEMYSCDDSDVFSMGDISRLRLGLLSGMSACLRSSSLQIRESLRSDTCGNGIIDRGEECEPYQQGLPIGLAHTTDFLFNASLNSPSFGCCDAKTCLASVHAVCVEGGCCRGCQLVARGRLCRPARDQCDLPEFCTGFESECSADLHLENGMPCKGGKEKNAEEEEEEEEALCYEGRCPTRSSHCKALWGANARTGDNYCYSTMNRNIDSACGDGVVCEEANTMCGLLHCQTGSDEPIPQEARSLSFFNLRTQHEKHKIQCQYVASTHKFSYVPEGASCDQGRFCFQKRCIKPTATAVHSKCPIGPFVYSQEGRSNFVHPAVRRSLPLRTSVPVNLTCSGRGICTNGAFCLCLPGWQGPACSKAHPQPLLHPNVSTAKPRVMATHFSVYPDEDIASLIWMYIQAMDKSPEELTEPTPVNTVYLISLLAAVIAFVFFCLCGIIFLYRRRILGNRECQLGAKNKRGMSSPNSRLSPPLFDSLLGKFVPNDTAVTTTANSMDSMCLCNRNSRSGGVSVDDMELHFQVGRTSRSHRRRHATSSSSKSRGRRRKRGGAGGGASSGDSLQAGANGAVESGPELGRNGDGDCVKDGDCGNGGGKIKFGSMPSYREDKMKHARESTTSPTTMTGIPTTSDAAVTTAVATTNVLQHQQQSLIDFSASWPPPPPPPPPFVVPVVCGVVATANSMFSGSSSPWISTSLSPSVNINSTTAATTYANSICTDSGGMMSTQSVRKVMTASAISGEETEAPQLTVIRENSCRQPEKGILKNKFEVGGVEMAGGNGASTGRGNGNNRRKHSSKKCRGSSPHFSSGATSTSSSSNSGSRSSSASSTGSSSSLLSTVSSCSTSRATDDTNSTNFVTSATNSGEEDEAEQMARGIINVVSDSESTCSTTLDTGYDGRKSGARKCRHKHHHRKHQCKKSSNHQRHRHHNHGHSHNRRHHQDIVSEVDALATNTSTTPTTTASNSSSSSPCHRRCHRRRRTGSSRRYHLSSEDAEGSISGQNHRIPTILCNAEQQTDEISLAKAAGVLFPAPISQKDLQSSSLLTTKSPNARQFQSSTPDSLLMEENSEWEEVECTGKPDCEECRKITAYSSWNTSAVPPAPPSAGGLLSRQYKLPSPPPLPPAVVASTPYYCTAQLTPQPEIDPYYQPPIEDADSFVVDKAALMPHLKYTGSTEEDDGLINSSRSTRVIRGVLPLNVTMGPSTDGCYMMKDSDGLARKNSPGVPYIARHDYNGSDSDFSLPNSVKKSPVSGHANDWMPSGNPSQAMDVANQWLDVAESDASSLPDASCDLVHLAQLSHAARMNPNLSDLARQQERIRLGADTPFYSKQP